MARRRREAEDTDTSHQDVIDWYRGRLIDEPAVLPWEGGKWTPVRYGPVWKVGDDGHWVLPERTLGWHVLGWCGTKLQHQPGRPWRFTMEQARFILWWYAVDVDGQFVFTDGVLQRLKGWGKDPLAACLCAVEMLGPCRVALDDDGEPLWDAEGHPVATDNPTAWVQTAAVSQTQTKNTFRLFPGLFSKATIAEYGLVITKEAVNGMAGTRLIEAVTSSPATLEGARPSLVLANETHHWLSTNNGHEMAAVIERNATKSEGGGARRLAITNAYEPGTDSVAQHDREAWEQAEAGRAADVGLLYDSLEADPKAPLSAEEAPAVARSIQGDSTWLNTERIVKSILDVRNPPSRSRRFWYNQIGATEDAWITPQQWDARADPSIVVHDGAVITLGFDGGETDDHTALWACDVERDHLWPIKIWTPPPGWKGSNWRVDRSDVDLTVRQTFARFDVVGFYADLHPWSAYLDEWAVEFGDQLALDASGREHAIAWDMRRTPQATKMIERLYAAIVEKDSTLTHDGDSQARIHFHNARRRPNRWGVSVGKESRESSKKIDSVPAAALARLARLEYLALPEKRRRRKKSRSGEAVVV